MNALNRSTVSVSVEPLIRRASSFGPYFWIYFLVLLTVQITVEAATGSYWVGLFAMLASVFLVGPRVYPADREYTLEKWLKEAGVGHE